MGDLLDTLREASEAARRERPAPMSAAELARFWEDHGPFLNRPWWAPRFFAEVLRLRELVQAFGAGGFDLESARAVYFEGQRMLEEEVAATVATTPGQAARGGTGRGAGAL